MAKKKTTKKPTAKKETSVELEGKIKESKGVGDVIEDISKATGIKAVVEAVSKATGLDCGCDRRKEALNSIFRHKVKCLEEDEYAQLKEFFDGNPTAVSPSEWRALTPIASRIFSMKIETSTGCDSCVRTVIDKLKRVYETYEKD
tara:strand:- start:1021 stop:1455 length:435 start_codon:yes stop_codon:yes gene_type:complete